MTSSYAPIVDLFKNTARLTDSYKYSHYLQYPHNTRGQFTYFASRGGRWPQTVFCLLQYYLRQYLTRPMSMKDVDEAANYVAAHFGNSTIFNYDGFKRIVTVHGGYLPLLIKAVPEGTPVWNRNALMTVENTDTTLWWLPTFMETMLEMVWYPCTVATLSREWKKMWRDYLDQTADSLEGLDYKLHDFGMRGSTSVESSAIGGAAHLINFKGTDTSTGNELLMAIYGAAMPGMSVPAGEHAAATAWGRAGQRNYFKHMMFQFPSGVVSIIADTYNIFEALDSDFPALKADIEARDGVVVARPDSGKPDEIVVRALNSLGRAFGTQLNKKEYKMLHPKIRIIYGDGIDIDTGRSIMEAAKADRFSVDNFLFGSGGGLLQRVDRDTQRIAMKQSAVRVGDAWFDTEKDPITDPQKKSFAGRLKLVRQGDQDVTLREDEGTLPNRLETVYRNGAITKTYTLNEVRENARI